MAEPLAPVVTIDVVSDVICPWCFVGKRRLDKAAQQLTDLNLRVVFRPFFLDPSIPAEGMDRHAYMIKKFGEERLKTIHDPLIAVGQQEGIPYAFDKITRTPNTLNAHRLLRWALPVGVQPQVKEALFMAYWSWGQDISDLDVLTTIAIVNGFRGQDIRKVLESDDSVKDVMDEAQLACKLGVTGVPTFIINRKYGLVGAQPVTALVDAIRKAAAESIT